MSNLGKEEEGKKFYKLQPLGMNGDSRGRVFRLCSETWRG